MEQRTMSQASYYAVFAALIALTMLTVSISFLSLGELHTAVGLAIASAKAVLVALFFMHLLHSPRLIWLVVVAGFFWLAIMMGGMLADYMTRGWLTYG